MEKQGREKRASQDEDPYRFPPAPFVFQSQQRVADALQFIADGGGLGPDPAYVRFMEQGVELVAKGEQAFSQGVG